MAGHVVILDSRSDVAVEFRAVRCNLLMPALDRCQPELFDLLLDSGRRDEVARRMYSEHGFLGTSELDLSGGSVELSLSFVMRRQISG